MAFISRYETAFAIALIFQCAVYNNYLSDYSVYILALFTLTVILGHIGDGIRVHIWLCYILHVINFLIHFYLGGSYAMSWVTAIIEALIAVLLVNVGQYYYLNPSGPYGVGHRQLVLKGETTPTVSVFYPIDRAVYDKEKTNYAKTSSLCLDGKHDTKGYSIAQEKPQFLFNDLRLFRLRAINDAELDKDFTDGGKKLTPVVVTHGLMGLRTAYASFVYYMVSYGCIVYCCTHTDTSASYFKDYTKDPPEDKYYVHYEQSGDDCTMSEYRMKQLNIRIKNIEQVVDLIKKESKSTISAIDVNKLVGFGHSMGGMTSLEMCYRLNKDFKLCVALDPYYSARTETIKNSKDFVLDQPFMIVTTETFPDHPYLEYDHREAHKKFVADSKEHNKHKTNYDLILKKASHGNQGELACIAPVTMKLTKELYFDSDPVQKYVENIEAVLAFMDEHDSLPIKFGKKVKDIIPE